MKAIEFETELQGEPFLSIPQEIAAKLPKSGHAKVIVLLDPEDQEWRRAAYEQFMKEDSPEDSIYDRY
jgi:hypothetical protein